MVATTLGGAARPRRRRFLAYSVPIAGWRAIRQRRYADHRKWMIRSFAMTMNTLTSRALSPIAFLLVMPRVEDKSELILSAGTLSAGLSILSLLLLSQWWLDRKPKKPATAR
ncbi:DUF2306 domain-containing protein [Amycolatopsis mediterranei]|uniref:DUF2306 domain-containing protein n=1 Tax=Amycolatopsis mediterranei TaxID=33910 RepID=UPI00342544BC